MGHSTIIVQESDYYSTMRARTVRFRTGAVQEELSPRRPVGPAAQARRRRRRGFAGRAGARHAAGPRRASVATTGVTRRRGVDGSGGVGPGDMLAAMPPRERRLLAFCCLPK
jgi:hypothetical protein